MMTEKKSTPVNQETELSAMEEENKLWRESLRIQKEEEAKQNKLKKDSMLRELSEPFSSEVERTLKKGGASLTYIPVSEVIARLNRVFGIDGWNSEIIKCERDALDPDFIVAHVRLTARIQDEWAATTHDGFGGQKIKRTKAGDIVDLGDEFKGAVSDALKKAAQQFGVALYLARSEEAMMLEAQNEINPQVEKLWEEFSSLAKGLDADARVALNNYWATTSGGAPKPRRETATVEMLALLIAECEVLSVGGTFEDVDNNGI
jgi:hypothetical protein